MRHLVANVSINPNFFFLPIASSPSPIAGKKDTLDSATTVDMEMADLTPPQHPKVLTNNDKIHHPNDFYVSVNEHKKGMLG